MPALATLLLWGPLALGAAAIPIALHFFYRSRYRIVPWAAMEFLLTSIQQTSRRLKFQEILLLAARVALMLLLALAMMRPSCSSLSNSGHAEAVDAVLIVDVSYSMAAMEDGVTRLQRAKEAANKIIDGLPSNSTVQIISSADHAVLLGPRSPSNFDQARQIIANLEVTDLATDFLPSANEALTSLQRGHASNKEVYLFSDMQKLGWQHETGAVKAAFDKLHHQGRVVLVRCGTKPPRNVMITGILPYSHFPQKGVRSTYVVEVRNTGKEAIRDVMVTLEIDGQTQDHAEYPLSLIEPGEKRQATLTAMPVRTGMQILSASLRAATDDLAPDNRFDQVINVRDKVRVLLVDGAPNPNNPADAGAFFLEQALTAVDQTLRPSKEPQRMVLDVHKTTARDAAASDLFDPDGATQDVCILVDVPLNKSALGENVVLREEFIQSLEAFVKAGRGLIIFPGPRVEAASYNEMLYKKYPLLPMKLAKPYTVPPNTPLDKLVFLDTQSIPSSSYLKLFRDKPYNQLGLVKLNTAFDLLPPDAEQETATTLLRYTNGHAAVVSKQHGNGEVIFVTTGWNATWSDWPKTIGHMHVPFLTETLKYLLHGSLKAHNRHAGQTLVWYPPKADQDTNHQLLTPPKNEAIRLDPPHTVGQRAVVSTLPIEHAGVYRITPIRASPDAETKPEPETEQARAQKIPAVYAVTPDLRESEDLSTLTETEIDQQLGFKADHLTAGQQLTAESVVRTSGEWWWYILLVVIAIAGFETVLAWICSRAW